METAARLDRMAPTLERLLAPLTPEEFFAGYWQERYLVLRREDPTYYRGLFSFADIDSYLALAARNPATYVSLIKAGQPVQRVELKGLPPSKLYGAFHAGVTLLFEGLERSWPPLARLADALRLGLSARIGINAYVTPPGTQGAHLHPDVVDVIALQLEGTKGWWLSSERVHEPPENLTFMDYLTDPGARAPYLRDESAVPLDRAELSPGDLLYMPRGVVHKAVATPDRPSLHLAITVAPVYWLDVLKALAEAASVEHRALARALPPGFERQSTRALAASLRQTLQAALDAMGSEETFARALDVLKRARAADVPYLGDGHFEQLARAEEIGPETRVVRRAGLACVVTTTAEGASIRFGQAEVKGPKAVGEALEAIRDRERFVVSELPGPLPPQSKVVLVKRLVREGLLRVEGEAAAPAGATTNEDPSS